MLFWDTDQVVLRGNFILYIAVKEKNTMAKYLWATRFLGQEYTYFQADHTETYENKLVKQPFELQLDRLECFYSDMVGF